MHMFQNPDLYFYKQQQTIFEILKMKNFTNPEYIRAITPLILAVVGCVIGAMVIFNPQLGDAQWTSAIGLAGTAITGAAGLAQSNGKNDV